MHGGVTPASHAFTVKAPVSSPVEPEAATGSPEKLPLASVATVPRLLVTGEFASPGPAAFASVTRPLTVYTVCVVDSDCDDAVDEALHLPEPHTAARTTMMTSSRAAAPPSKSTLRRVSGSALGGAVTDAGAGADARKATALGAGGVATADVGAAATPPAAAGTIGFVPTNPVGVPGSGVCAGVECACVRGDGQPESRVETTTSV